MGKDGEMKGWKRKAFCMLEGIVSSFFWAVTFCRWAERDA
jgi:hypothetical protein